MNEINTGGLTEPSQSVVAALRGIHPGLFVLRSRFQLDQSSGRPLHDEKGEPIDRPRYWVAIDHRGQKSLLFPVESPEGEYMPFDMRVVRRLGTDIGFVSDTVEEQWRLLEEQEAKKEEARAGDERERFRRFMENNKPAWRQAMENLKAGRSAAGPRVRDPVIYGYDGQAVRSSRFNTVPMSAKEQGIDVQGD